MKALASSAIATIAFFLGLPDGHAFDETDWSVRCWNGETKAWEDFRLEKMTITKTGDGVAKVTNTSGIHRHAHLVFPATPETGDFTFTIELKGGYELGFLNRAGKDEMLYVELEDAKGNPKATDFETWQISRVGTRYTIQRNGRVVPLVHFRFDYGEPSLLTLAIMDGESAEIRSYQWERAE